MDMRMNALIVVLLFAFSSCASAMSAQSDTFGDVALHRIYPESAYIGQRVWITIAVENAGADDKTIEITEKLGDADFGMSDVQDVNTTFGSMYLYEWEIYLPAGENTSVSYWIEPRSPGNYVISPSEVKIEGESYRMKSAVIAVSCLADGACGAGENFLNCPEDCASGGADGVCDGVIEGICDPDCAAGFDADCAEPAAPAENITQDITNETKPDAVAQIPGPEKEGPAGPDLAAYAPYVIILAIVIIAAIFFMKRKK